MHPAKSVIFFTTASGAGYGLFIWIAILFGLDLLPVSKSFALAAMLIALGLITAGLLSSTFHLGHPERAWRALSQWKSSWLSREGVLAILTYIPMCVFGLSWVFTGLPDAVMMASATIGAGLSFATVFATSMIYASLRTIPAWNSPLTSLNYLLLSLMSGAVILLGLGAIFAQTIAWKFLLIPSLVLLASGFLSKIYYWSKILNRNSVSTAETATGLGRFGKVSLAGSPHSQDNFLLKEMGYQIARKHADKIRIYALFMGFLLPFGCLATGFFNLNEAVHIPLFILAVISMLIGLIFERWLFFAEAKHVVTLYYGESEV